jgi:hypothetical protein
MAGLVSNICSDKWDLPAKASFSVVVIYEEVSSAQRAMRLIGDVLRGSTSQSGFEPSFEPSLWKLEMLLVPKFRELAAQEAAAADVVVIAARDRDTLPVALQGWIETWPPRNPSNRGALVALLWLTEGQAEVQEDSLAFFRKAADQVQMDLFVQSFPPPARSVGLTPEQIVQRAGLVSSVLDDILHCPAPAPRWGINE